MEWHGGALLAESAPGWGAVFRMELPVGTMPIESGRAAIPGKRILLVVDEAQVATVLTEILALSDRIVVLDGDGEAQVVVGARSSLFLPYPNLGLIVVDEAHEVFAGIYRRFDRYGSYRDDAAEATTAARLRSVLAASGTPVLLLTATPIQNSLSELWGLVQYVDPTGTLLGDLGTFRALFCGEDDRILDPGQEHELRQRMNRVVKRTLRRQAQEFMERPFVGRHAQLFEYEMSLEERALYDDVRPWLWRSGKPPAGPVAHGPVEMMQLLATLERLSAADKRTIGELLLERVQDGATPADESGFAELPVGVPEDRELCQRGVVGLIHRAVTYAPLFGGAEQGFRGADPCSCQVER